LSSTGTLKVFAHPERQVAEGLPLFPNGKNLVIRIVYPQALDTAETRFPRQFARELFADHRTQALRP
jgi:hypothetical protein